MAAQSTGGAAARLRIKNSEMAAYMKNSGNCPMCHRLVGRETYLSGGAMYSHILSCKGR